MTKFLMKARDNAYPSHKRPHVYFACHPDDFAHCFDRICHDILRTHDCMIDYTEDMCGEMEETDANAILGSANLFVIPVTRNLLFRPNRAVDFDCLLAKQRGISILPIIMECDWNGVFTGDLKKRYQAVFGNRQFVEYYSHDLTAIHYRKKLKASLDRLLFDDQIAKVIREEFDAYIFLSYRKVDRHYANTLMRLIHAYPEYRDVAIWYDEFLTLSENFQEKINQMIEESQLFTLLVTPRVLEYVDGEPNYVMKHEYPHARDEAAMPILPAEMECTDKDMLSVLYQDIPECVNPGDVVAFKKRLEEALATLVVSKNNAPKHEYLIGLAYLEGIDVEINKDVALKLIRSAAEAGLPEAMETLYWMYNEGKNVPLDYAMATEWAIKLLACYQGSFGAENRNTLKAMNYLATAYGKQNKRDQALALFEESYALHCRLYGETDADSLYTLGKLAYTYSKLKNYQEACRLYERAYSIRMEVLGEEDPDTIRSLSNLASAYHKNGKYRESYALYIRLYDLSNRVLGEKHYRTVRTREKLSQLREKLAL